MSEFLQPLELQHARPPCPSPTPRVCPNSCPSCQWCHPTISSSIIPLLLPPSIFPSIQAFSNESALCIQALGLEFRPQYQSFQWAPRANLLYDGLVGSPCSPRDSQESSPTPQFKSINSSALSFLYRQNVYTLHIYVCNIWYMFPGSGRSHREGHGNSLQYLSFPSWPIHLVWILVIAKYSSIQLILNANLVIDY